MQSYDNTPARIVVVEDDPAVATVIHLRLESFGYVVCEVVPSGDDAIRSIEVSIPDLVIMDIKIEGTMDGIETAAIIRNRYDVPIIFLTSYADDKLLKRAKVTQPFDYIIKPYEEKQLHVAVEMALYKHRLDQEKQKLIAELQDALKKVKKLSGLLPICSSCKKIRNDGGYWDQVEEYIRKHSEAEFTHSICPECVQKLYPDLNIRNKKQSFSDSNKKHIRKKKLSDLVRYKKS